MSLFSDAAAGTRVSAQQEFRSVQLPNDIANFPLPPEARFATKSYAKKRPSLKASEGGKNLLSLAGMDGQTFQGTDMSEVISKLGYEKNRGYGIINAKNELITSRKGWSKLLFNNPRSKEAQIFRRHPVVTALHYYNKVMSASRVLKKWIGKSDEWKLNRLKPISAAKRNLQTVKKLIKKPYTAADRTATLSKIDAGQLKMRRKIKGLVDKKVNISTSLRNARLQFRNNQPDPNDVDEPADNPVVVNQAPVEQGGMNVENVGADGRAGMSEQERDDLLDEMQ